MLSNLYDKYGAALYAVLLSLTESTAQAETALVEVFKTIQRNNFYPGHSHCMATHLLRLTVITAYSGQLDNTTMLQRFNALPRLHRLLIGHINFSTSANEAPANPLEYGRAIAGELRLFQSAVTKSRWMQ